jgi:transposase
MSQPYSADLRERVLVACERGDLPQVEIARRFQVCPATVSNWRRQERDEGRRAPKPHSGGVPSRCAGTTRAAGIREYSAGLMAAADGVGRTRL